MAGLQDIIYSLEVGSLRQWMFRLTLVLIVAVVGGIHMVQFGSFKSREAMDNSQLAKNIAQGKGYVTQVIRPVAIRNMQRSDIPNDEIDLFDFKETITPPVYPYVIGTLFKVLGTNFDYPVDKLKSYNGFTPEKIINFFNFLCVLTSVVVFYLWMVRAFDTRVAFVSAALYALSGIVWYYSTSGLNICLLLLFITLIGFLLNEALQANEQESLAGVLIWICAASVLVGLSVLTDYVLWVFALAFIVFSFVAFRQQGLVIGGVVTMIIALIVTPWLIRNILVSGNPLGLSWLCIFADNGRVVGDALWRSMGPEVSAAVGLRPLIRAFMLGLDGEFKVIGNLLGTVVGIILGGASLFHIFRRPWVQYSHWFWGIVFFLMLFSNAFIFRYHSRETWMENNLMVLLLPAALGFGSAFLYVLLDRSRITSEILTYPIIFIVCLFQAYPLVVQLRGIGKATGLYSAFPPYYVPMILASREWLDKDEIMVSDIPWATAWYQDRVSLWLPYRKVEELYEINGSIHEVSSILLSPYSSGKKLSEIREGEYKEWKDQILLDSLNIPMLPYVTGLPKAEIYLYMTKKKSTQQLWEEWK